MEAPREFEISKLYPARKQLKDIWRYAKGYRHQIIFFLILTVISSLIGLIPPFLLGRIIDDLTKGVFGQVGLFLGITAISVILFQIFANILAYYTKVLSAILRNQSKLMALDHLFGMDYDFYESNPMGKLLGRIDAGAWGVRETVKVIFKQTILYVFNIIFIIGVIASNNLFAGVYSAIVVILFYTIARFYLRKQMYLENQTFKTSEKVYSKVYDFMSHIQVVKFLNIRKKLISILKKAFESVIEKTRRARKMERKSVALNKIILEASAIALLAYLANSVIGAVMTIGTLVMIITYYNKLTSNVKEVWNDYNLLIEHRTGMYRLSLIFQQKPRITEPEHPKRIGNWDKILFEDVSFKYPSKKVAALKDVSFSISKGERIAIVGVSGSGKSTIAKLLLRQYLPKKGEIRISDIKLNDIASDDLYGLIKIVPQDNQLMDATIQNNLKIAARHPSEKKIIESLKMASAWNFVSSLPEKLNTFVGPDGIKLSGGEKQRICIARALLSEPEVLVLDEATSHLDVIAEKEIYENLKNLPKSVTVIAITHRIASASAFDRIIVMSKGAISNIGTHSQLISKDKNYVKLWKASKHKQ